MQHPRFTDWMQGRLLGTPAEAAAQVAATIAADAQAVPGDDRLVRVAFSSEQPILLDLPGVGPVWEVLGHAPGEVDLSRLNSGAAPLLVEHRHELGSMLGTVAGAQVEAGRGRATVRFADTPEANAMLARVRSGEVQSVSVGYRPQERRQVGERDGFPVVRVTRWEAVEISLVAIPADPTVGIGRSLAAFNLPSPKGFTMSHPNSDTPVLNERGRASEIAALGRQFSLSEGAVSDAIARGTSVADFSAQVLDNMGTRGNRAPATRSRDAGNGFAVMGKERPYSLTRAIQAELTGDWREAGLERELNQELGRVAGRTANGIYVPTLALAGRALITSTTAPALIGTAQMAEAFVDVLRSEVRVIDLGATVLPGLVENVSIPRMTAGAAAEWIAEDAEASESTPTFDAVSLTMRQLSARTRMSRRQLKQSMPALDLILANDLRQQIAVALDRAAIQGTGANNQPLGILNNPGVGVQAIGANGGPLTWAAVTALVARVESANVSPAGLGWLTNHKVKAALMSTPKVAGTESMMLNPDELKEPAVAGHRAAFSGNVPSNLAKGTGTNLSAMIFGNWPDLLIGQWGGVDLILDEVTEAGKGNVRIVAHSEWDVALRHPESFAVIKDATTPA